MFTLISWQQYLYAVTALTSAYYAVIISLYYRQEVFACFSGKRHLQEEPDRPNDFSIMGKAPEEANQTSISTEDLQFNSESEHLS
jgi:hypothetical protein